MVWEGGGLKLHLLQQSPHVLQRVGCVCGRIQAAPCKGGPKGVWGPSLRKTLLPLLDLGSSCFLADGVFQVRARPGVVCRCPWDRGLLVLAAAATDIRADGNVALQVTGAEGAVGGPLLLLLLLLASALIPATREGVGGGPGPGCQWPVPPGPCLPAMAPDVTPGWQLPPQSLTSEG